MARVFLFLLAVLAFAGCGESRANRWTRLAGDAVPLTSPVMLEGTYRNQARGRPAFLLWNYLAIQDSASVPDDVVRLTLVENRKLQVELVRAGTPRSSIVLDVVASQGRVEVPRRTTADNAMVVVYSISQRETDLGLDGDGRLVIVGSGGGATVFIALPLDAGGGEFTATFERADR